MTTTLKSTLEPISPFPALLLKTPNERTLVIADIHIGWEVALSHQGIHIPSQTHRLIEKLKKIVSKASPTELVILGDVKHTIAKVELEEWRDVPEFLEHALKLVPKVSIIPGNHDGNLEPLTPRDVSILPTSGAKYHDTIAFIHGHALPSPDLLSCLTLVMSHIHPIVIFRDRLGFRVMKQVWVKAECDRINFAHQLLRHSKSKIFHIEPRISKCIIMPSFNDFVGGQPINGKRSWKRLKKEYIGPIFRWGAIDMESAEVHMLDGTFLGKISHLKTLV